MDNLRFEQDGDDQGGWLIGGTVYRFIMSEHTSSFGVSANVFTDSDEGTVLTFAARQAGGMPLPDWLIFDPRTVTFSGIPPAGFVGTLDLEVIGTDTHNRSAFAEVHVFVGRDPKDLLALLAVREPGKQNPINNRPALLPGTTRGAEARPHRHGHAVRADTPHRLKAAQADMAVPVPRQVGSAMFSSSTLGGQAGLSSQIRDAGHAGRLAGQRRFLAMLGSENPT